MEGAADVAAESEDGPSGVAQLAEKLLTPVIVTVLGAMLTAVVVPRISERFQTKQQQLDVRTALASDMSGAFANALLRSRFVARGAIYAPSTDKVVQKAATQAEFNSMLKDWTIANAELNAQLSARYAGGLLALDWRKYGRAVEGYVRLSGDPPERPQILDDLKTYVDGGVAPDWSALQRRSGFKRDKRYLAAYDMLGRFLLARGEALVERVLDVQPRV